MQRSHNRLNIAISCLLIAYGHLNLNAEKIVQCISNFPVDVDAYTRVFKEHGDDVKVIAVDIQEYESALLKKKGIFNLGTGHAQSWNELAKALFKACGKKENIEYIEMPDELKNQYQYFTQADLKKFLKTGCPVKFQNLENGVNNYVKNHLSNQDPYL